MQARRPSKRMLLPISGLFVLFWVLCALGNETFFQRNKPFLLLALGLCHYQPQEVELRRARFAFGIYTDCFRSALDVRLKLAAILMHKWIQLFSLL